MWIVNLRRRESILRGMGYRERLHANLLEELLFYASEEQGTSKEYGSRESIRQPQKNASNYSILRELCQ